MDNQKTYSRAEAYLLAGAGAVAGVGCLIVSFALADAMVLMGLVEDEPAPWWGAAYMASLGAVIVAVAVWMVRTAEAGIKPKGSE